MYFFTHFIFYVNILSLPNYIPFDYEFVKSQLEFEFFWREINNDIGNMILKSNYKTEIFFEINMFKRKETVLLIKY